MTGPSSPDALVWSSHSEAEGRVAGTSRQPAPPPELLALLVLPPTSNSTVSADYIGLH